MQYEHETRALIRLLDQMDAREPSLQPSGTSVYPVKAFEDRAKRTRAYFLESCLTALSTDDPMVAVRSACQAFAYSGEDWARSGDERGIYGCERDYLIAVRNRIEAMVAARD